MLSCEEQLQHLGTHKSVISRKGVEETETIRFSIFLCSHALGDALKSFYVFVLKAFVTSQLAFPA